MPNTVVKLTNAESTWLEAAREDRKLLIKLKDSIVKTVESFFVLLIEFKRGYEGVLWVMTQAVEALLPPFAERGGRGDSSHWRDEIGRERCGVSAQRKRNCIL